MGSHATAESSSLVVAARPDPAGPLPKAELREAADAFFQALHHLLRLDRDHGATP